ncbi:MAG: PAS domain-containing protein, partial [Gammaproteobacteria bacterium]
IAHHDLDVKIEQRTSDLKESYKALAKLEQRFAQLLNSSPSAIYATSLDKPHLCRYVSHAFTELTGYEADEIIADPDFWLDHIHPDDRQLSTNGIDQASATGGGSVTYRFRHKKGEYRWIRDNFRLVNDAEGNPFEIIGAWTDITNEMTASHALKESEERFRIAAESSNDLIYEWDMDSGALLWFGDIDGALNYTPEVFPRTSEAWENSLHPEDQARIREAKNNHLANSTVPFDQQYRIRTRNGQYKIWRDCGKLVMRDGSQTGKWIGSCTDITKAKRLEQQFMQAQKMETVGLLAGGIAHDFNNLLTAIIGFSDMCLQSPDLDATNREYLNEVKGAGMRAADLTRQLLAFSRKQVIAPVILDINGVVSGMEKMLRRLIAENIRLTFTLEPALMRVNADPSQIEQIVMNLVINARDAMPNGGELMILTKNMELDKSYVTLHPEVTIGPYVMLAISDTGTGIPQEDQARIFEPFFTTKEKGKGTGLGLATVYGIVKQSNGYIYLYSELGMGTTFRIYLPPAEAREALPGTAPESRQLMSRNHETVLLVEDESNVRSLAHMILKSCGYNILEAESGDAALRLCDQQEGPIHLLLSDVIMPGMNGHELASRLLLRYPGLRVLYISGYTDDVITRHGILTEGTVFLSKPFTSEALARKVHDVLNNS